MTIRGLGTELVKRSEILARDMGCEVAVAIGMYCPTHRDI
jgi:hypothetical protein